MSSCKLHRPFTTTTEKDVVIVTASTDASDVVKRSFDCVVSILLSVLCCAVWCWTCYP